MLCWGMLIEHKHPPMRLQKLTLAGFKSFAKSITFAFPAPVAAIVGPNGSGKSNVAEAIRWVLGEQSLKTIRGKRGEDLIWHGSPRTPRLGRATVSLTIDNRDRRLPLDFTEVAVERKIFRDGTSQYFLNGSTVRLKDIIELLARLGLGETKHNIIGQGEVDHILGASARERREILEEAIGLRLAQLKKREAERKLEETDRNRREIEGLIREIAPHLKFLKTQAEKAEKREATRRELEEALGAYAAREGQAIGEDRKRIERDEEPLRHNLAAAERDSADRKRDIAAAESGADDAAELASKEKLLEGLEAKRRGLEREFGRIEGRLESEPQSRPPGWRGLDVSAAESALRPFVASLREVMALDAIDEIRRRVSSIAAKIEALLKQWYHEASRPGPRPGGHALEAEKQRIRRDLHVAEAAIREARKNLAHARERASAREQKLREYWQGLRQQEETASSLRNALQRSEFELERVRTRAAELERIIGDSGLSPSDLKPTGTRYDTVPSEELRRKIEKLKVRLEETGGIDLVVLKEYSDTKGRHEFLTRELADLSSAEKDLKRLIAELDAKIERDFKTGFGKVREAFQHYFRIIFGGGKGTIEYVALRRPKAGMDEELSEGEGGEVTYGVEISVDIPRKRIRGLDMLSGGERALVSVALLFAITAVNPPPFLVLDETDAALDEANSQKYAAILKELSKKTQLILITHNRETMKVSGVLYGVTMGDDGISKILSLQLEEAEGYRNR